MQITGDTMIGDILDADAGCVQVFEAFGMPCVDCPAARGESLEEACQLHGVDLAELLSRLKAHLN